MSERGSFVTEFINCKHCLDAAEKILCSNDKYLHGIRVSSWNKTMGALPIIAGKIGGMSPGGELTAFEVVIKPLLESAICHRLRVAVIADDGEEIFVVYPNNKGSCNAPKGGE